MFVNHMRCKVFMALSMDLRSLLLSAGLAAHCSYRGNNGVNSARKAFPILRITSHKIQVAAEFLGGMCCFINSYELTLSILYYRFSPDDLDDDIPMAVIKRG